MLRRTLEEEAEQISKKYHVEHSKAYDMLLYLRGRDVLRNPLLKIWHRQEVQEDAYELAKRYFQMEDYKRRKEK